MGGRKVLLFIGLAAIAAVFLVTSASSKGPKRDEATILVKFQKPGSDEDQVQQDGDQAVGETKTRTKIIKIKRGASVDEKIAEYEARDDVVYAEENGTASATTMSAPNDALFSSQWGLTKVNALNAWSLLPGSYHGPDGPPIAVVDSGVDAQHPDLSGRVATDLGANCLTGTCVSDGADDDYGHGTHVAGIAAAAADDGVGVAGLAYNAPIIPVKVLDSTGNGSYASVASGIIYAADQGADVINVSLGSTSYSQTVCDAVTYANAHGALVIAAAGNYGTTTPFYPAACSGAIGVGATDSTDTVASFSERGFPNVFLSAPGVGIVSDLNGGGYKTDSGTSMAAPFVSALAELLFTQDGNRTAGDVKRLLAGTSDKVGSVAYGSDPYATCACSWNSSYGYGRINAYRALTEPPPAAAADFSLTTSPATLNVLRSTSGKFTVSSASSNGFSSSVALSVSGLPTGVTASFSPTTIAGVGSSSLTVTASATAPFGSYPLTITGTSGALTRTAQATLVVPTPDFSLNLAPTSATVIQTEKSTTSISLTNLNGFKNTVNLAVSGMPAGVTSALSRTSTSGTTAVTLTVSTTSLAAPGTYPLTITGTSGTQVHTAIYSLTVALAVPDFTIVSATTSSSVRYGRATTIAYKLTLTPKYGFKGPISMSASGNPLGSTGTWSPLAVNITSTSAGTSTYTLVLPVGTPIGKYTVTLSGNGGGTTHSATALITVS